MDSDEAHQDSNQNLLCNHAWLIIHEHTFYGQYSTKTNKKEQQHQHHMHLFNAFKYLYHIMFFHQIFMSIFHIPSKSSIISHRKVVHASI